jgi:hypothetical protein
MHAFASTRSGSKDGSLARQVANRERPIFPSGMSAVGLRIAGSHWIRRIPRTFQWVLRLGLRRLLALLQPRDIQKGSALEGRHDEI